MAEAIVNDLGKGRYEAVSAGARPSGYVHPLSLKTIEEAGLPIAGLRSKSWDEFKGQRFDLVITVCDNAKESCPVWPGATMVHWSIQDPGDAHGSEEERMKHFRKIFEELKQRIGTLLAEHK
jgi:arsenate reductase